MQYSNLFKKITEYGLYLFIFLLPWQTRWIWHQGKLNQGFWEYGTFSLYATDILLVFLIFLCWIIKLKEEQKTYIGLLSYVFLILSLFFIFNSQDKTLAFYAFLNLLGGILLLKIALKIKLDIKKVSIAFVTAGFIQSCLAIWQWLSQSVFSSKWLGMAEQISSKGGVSVLESLSGRWLRAYGSLPHPNILAGFLVICLLMLAGLYFSAKKLKERCIYLIIFCFLILGLFLTFSRGAWLTLFISLFFLLILVWTQNQSFRKPLLELIVIVLTMAILFSLIISDPVLTRISGEQRLEIKSTEQRVLYTGWAREIIKENWLFGVGIGNFTLFVHDNINAGLKSWDYQPVHNIYLLIFCELGIFGLLIFGLLIFYLTKIFFASFKKNKNNWFLIYSTAILGILFLGLWDHYFWTLHFGIMLFWLLIGLWFVSLKSHVEAG